MIFYYTTESVVKPLKTVKKRKRKMWITLFKVCICHGGDTVCMLLRPAIKWQGWQKVYILSIILSFSPIKVCILNSCVVEWIEMKLSTDVASLTLDLLVVRLLPDLWPFTLYCVAREA